MEKDWINILYGSTCERKFNQFSDTLNTVLDGIAPKKMIKISSKHRYIEPWITKGLEKASREKLKLYQKSIQASSTIDDRKEYSTYCNIYNNLKWTLKTQYYQDKCEQFKDNAKKLWPLINNTTKKVKHKGSIISYIKIDGKLNYIPKSVANSFGKFYLTLGPSMANQIVPGMTPIQDFIQQIPRQRVRCDNKKPPKQNQSWI